MKTKTRRRWAWSLVPLYWAGLRAKDAFRSLGILRTHRLPWPVVSIGSLSAGGAGKTPVVIALAELLQSHGWSVDVLSRGYRRTGAGVGRVHADADDAAQRFGDEPVLIAQRTGVPVWVGAQRFLAGQAAQAASQTQSRRVHLLDDGFQHRQLARTLDVVLLTAEDIDDSLLPAGNRREPFSALARADAIVIREEERGQVLAGLRRSLRKDAVIWTICRQISFAPGADLASTASRPIVFSAIARPSDFLQTLRDAGVNALETVAFPDHHAYTADDIGVLKEISQRLTGSSFITTEKDAVKLSPALRAQLEASCPLVVARLHTSFTDEAAVLRAVEARIA